MRDAGAYLDICRLSVHRSIHGPKFRASWINSLRSRVSRASSMAALPPRTRRRFPTRTRNTYSNISLSCKQKASSVRLSLVQCMTMRLHTLHPIAESNPQVSGEGEGLLGPSRATQAVWVVSAPFCTHNSVRSFRQRKQEIRRRRGKEVGRKECSSAD